jgi:hypothetical protein
LYAVEESKETQLCSFYEGRLDELLDDMFLGESWIETPEDWERKEEKLMEIYQEVWTNELVTKTAVPELSDILDAVYDHNMEIQSEIVALDLEYGQYGERSFYVEDFYDDKEDAQEAVEEAWENDLNIETNYMYNTDSLVLKILHKLKCSFLANEQTLHEFFCEDWPEGCDAVVGDCQNLLLPEWHLASMQEYEHSVTDEERILVQLVSR